MIKICLNSVISKMLTLWFGASFPFSQSRQQEEEESEGEEVLGCDRRLVREGGSGARGRHYNHVTSYIPVVS